MKNADQSTDPQVRTPPRNGWVDFTETLAVLPGDRLVSAGRDWRVRVWDLLSGQQVKVFTGHTR